MNKKLVKILTTVLLIVIFYLFGLLTKISAVTKSKEWFENNVLSYVPNYSKFNVVTYYNFRLIF